jgi:hypothetical protein
MDQNEAIVTVLVLALSCVTVLSIIKMWFAHRRNANPNALATVESRLARVEVALDDVTAELGRMTEANQLLAKALSDRQQQALPLR